MPKSHSLPAPDAQAPVPGAFSIEGIPPPRLRQLQRMADAGRLLEKQTQRLATLKPVNFRALQEELIDLRHSEDWRDREIALLARLGVEFILTHIESETTR